MKLNIETRRIIALELCKQKYTERANALSKQNVTLSEAVYKSVIPKKYLELMNQLPKKYFAISGHINAKYDPFDPWGSISLAFSKEKLLPHFVYTGCHRVPKRLRDKISEYHHASNELREEIKQYNDECMNELKRRSSFSAIIKANPEWKSIVEKVMLLKESES